MEALIGAGCDGGGGGTALGTGAGAGAGMSASSTLDSLPCDLRASLCLTPDAISVS